MADRLDAIAQLRRYAGLSEAEAGQVVDAVVAAAQDEALEQIVSDALVPSTLAAGRVARLARVCGHLGRALSASEVEVVLRVPPSTAQSLLRQLRASYRGESDAWDRLLLSGAEISDASSEEAGERWRFAFADAAAVDIAVGLLRREGMTRDLTVSRREQAVTVPKLMRDRQGTDRDPRAVLGL